MSPGPCWLFLLHGLLGPLGTGLYRVAGSELKPIVETVRTVILNTELVAKMARRFGSAEDVKPSGQRFSLHYLPWVLPLVGFSSTSTLSLRLDSRVEIVGVSV